MWELVDSTGVVRNHLSQSEARELVIVNADPTVFARSESGAEMRWPDVADGEGA
jgi:hypothetical protein